MSRRVNDGNNGFGVLTKYVTDTKGMSVTDFNGKLNITDKTARNWKAKGYRQGSQMSNIIFKIFFDVPNSFDRFLEYLTKNNYVFPWEDYADDEKRAFHEFLCTDINELTKKTNSEPQRSTDVKLTGFSTESWYNESIKAGARFNHLRDTLDEDILPKLIPVSEQKKQPTADTEAETNTIKILDIIQKKLSPVFISAKGGMGKSSALFYILRARYDDDDKYRDRELIPDDTLPIFVQLSSAPSADPDKVIYRNGESTFLRREVYKQLTGDNNAFNKDTNILTIYSVLDNYLSSTEENHKFILLFDGVNEISRTEVKFDDLDSGRFYSPAIMLQEELTFMIQRYPNVRFIMTGRGDVHLCDTADMDKYWADSETEEKYRKEFFLMEYNIRGLDKSQINTYLAKKKGEKNISPETQEILQCKIETIEAEPLNSKLLELLSSPLFLILYSRIENDQTISTRGELLKAYYHNNKSPLNPIYNYKGIAYSEQERNKQISLERENKNSLLTGAEQAFILDFLLPQLAYSLGQNYSFTYEQAVTSLSSVLKGSGEGEFTYVLTDICGKFGKAAFPKYKDNRNENNTGTRAIAEKMLGHTQGKVEYLWRDYILPYCIYTWNILTTDSYDNYMFFHDYVKEYFCCSKIINDLKIAQTLGHNENQNAAYDYLTSVLGGHPLPVGIRGLVGESVGEHKNAPYFDKEDGKWIYPLRDHKIIQPTDDRQLIEDMLDLCRGRADEGKGYVVWNLMEILKSVRGDLAGIDLSGIDLRKCSLNGVPLSKPGLVANFDGAKVNRENIFPMGHVSSITSMVFQPILHNYNLLSVSLDNHLKIWDIQTSNCISSLDIGSALFHITINPTDSTYVLCSCQDRTAKIINCETMEYAYVLNDHTKPVLCSAYNSDATIIATASADHTVKLWKYNEENQEYRCCATSEKYPSRVDFVQFSPDNKHLLTAYSTSKGCLALRIWKLESDFLKEYEEIIVEGYSSFNISIAYKPDDGTQILISKREYEYNKDGIIIINSLTLDEIQNTIYDTYIHCAQYSSDGKSIITFGSEIIVWDADSYNELYRLPNCVGWFFPSVCINTDNQYLACVDKHTVIHIFDLNNKSHFNTLQGYIPSINSISFSSEGYSFVASSSDGSAKIFSKNEKNDWTCTGVLLGNSEISTVMYNPDKDIKQIVTADYSGEVKIWDFEKQIPIYSLLNSGGFRRKSVSFNMNGLKVFASDDFAIWDYDKGTVGCCGVDVTCMSERPDPTQKLKSEDPRFLSLYNDGETVLLWGDYSYSIGRPLCVLKVEEELWNNRFGRAKYIEASYSLDGERILTIQNNGIIKLWDATLETCYTTFTTENEGILSGTFNHDCTEVIITTGYYVKRFKIAQDESSQFIIEEIIEKPSIEEKTVKEAIFSFDGKYILTASFMGVCKIWDAHTHECLCTVENIPGLFVQGIDFTKLAETNLNAEDREKLRMYGAVITQKTDESNQ